ncbi:hypothetical protein PRZ48_001834 [Zasmidium cellare]|uniref:Uncharacterized protein n=1 Tax=Zasmidium cellare TaxID=395010 RepID=A0ABR0F2C1_ZASCE|nr:hypothetical protein PRZ48_001834 [Zasmidium cellare]
MIARSLRRSAPSKRTIQSLTRHQQPQPQRTYATLVNTPVTLIRPYQQPTALYSSSSNKSAADEKIEEITELYATAQDEFEIAMEETEKLTVYAEEDRKAAREELEKVKEAYQQVVGGEDKELAEEVKRRIGQRIRELEHGVAAMEELAQNQD